ncbi:MAG TPA: glutamyl-tRNA reductase, partial [Candidatus Omnitrophota bacterium]|nr:glutamyl-tRNA reductase [Candidatus Omnitrophota bacterium]
ERIPEADILIASTLAPKVLIHKEQVKGWMKARHQKPLFMIDIAVPRNIDTAAGEVDNVYLYNIDDLEAITTKNLELRRGGLEAGLRLVKDQREHFMSWLGKEFKVSPVC